MQTEIFKKHLTWRREWKTYDIFSYKYLFVWLKFIRCQ